MLGTCRSEWHVCGMWRRRRQGRGVGARQRRVRWWRVARAVGAKFFGTCRLLKINILARVGSATLRIGTTRLPVVCALSGSGFGDSPCFGSKTDPKKLVWGRNCDRIIPPHVIAHPLSTLIHPCGSWGQCQGPFPTPEAAASTHFYCSQYLQNLSKFVTCQKLPTRIGG